MARYANGGDHGGRKPRGGYRITTMRDDGTTIGDYVIAKIRTGIPLDVALGASGVPKATYMSWLNQAARLSERRCMNPNAYLTPGEQRLLAWSHAVDAATAEAEARSWGNVDALASGGLQTRRVSRRTVTDPDGRQHVTDLAETQTMLPDLAALRWQLENRYGRHRPLEVRVEAGKLTDDQRADELRTALVEFVTERRAAIDVDSYEGNGHTGNGDSP